MPDLYIITGSNRAGKSSVGPTYLPDYIKNSYTIFDGDKLFVQKQRELWKQGIRAHKEAKKLAFSFVEETFDTKVILLMTQHGIFRGDLKNMVIRYT
jgi:predicted ABC-type ATPase